MLTRRLQLIGLLALLACQAQEVTREHDPDFMGASAPRDATLGLDLGAPWDAQAQDASMLRDVGQDARPQDASVLRDAAQDTRSQDAQPQDSLTPEDAARDAQPVDGPDDPTLLVVVTLNTHSFQEGPDSLEKLTQIGQGLAALKADLIGLNEVMSGRFWAYGYDGASHDGAALIRAALEEASGEPYHLYRHGFAHWADGEEMSNVILSRFPIIEAGFQPLTTTDFWPGPAESREVIYARMEVPRLGLLNLFVTHTGGFDSADTLTQIQEVKAFMAARFREDEALDLLIGDLNTPSTWPHYSSWLHAPPFELLDTYATGSPGGFDDPTQLDGEHRIDYIFAGAGWPISEDPTRYLSAQIFDGQEVRGVRLPVVSDHKGVMTIFSL